jgi:hypothetical protein
MMTITLMVLGLTVMLGGGHERRLDHRAAFERLERLEGVWVGSRSAVGDTTRLTYRTASNGTVVTEILNEGGADEMINMYHLVDGVLEATHYCAAGNQPRLRLVEANERELRFVAVGGTNLDLDRDGHIHVVSLTFRSDGRIDSRWIWYEGSRPEHDNTFTVGRVP